MFSKYGNIDVEFEWDRPSWSKFSKFKVDLLNEEYVDNFEVFLCGGFLNNKDTWDIDIILTNEKNELELEKLENLLFKLTKLCFDKYNMLLDIQYQRIFKECEYIFDIDDIEKRKLISNKYKNIKTDNYICANKIYKYEKLFWEDLSCKKIRENLYYREKLVINEKREYLFLHTNWIPSLKLN